MPAVAIATLIALMLETVSAKGAALALVLAVDVSASVTADSYLLQHDGIARAFANPRLAEAISAAPGGIEVLVLEWSDPDKIAVTVDWTRIADGPSTNGFAAAVRASRRSSAGLTAIGPALIAAAAAFDHLPEPAGHRMIDISGDGTNNSGRPVTEARDQAIAQGATINGLAIINDKANLGYSAHTQPPGGLPLYYKQNVIGGPNAFLLVVQDFNSFADAMANKLAKEIDVAGAGTENRLSSLR